MKTDDPRLVKAREELTERIRKYDETIVTVLKNHLGCEHFLNELLAASSKKWKGRKFAGKMEIAKKLNLPELEPAMWEVLDKGNKLRNQIAHSPDQGKIAAKLTALRRAYLAALTPEQAKGSENLNDMQLVVLAFGHVGSHLVVAAGRVTQERKEKQGDASRTATSDDRQAVRKAYLSGG